VTKPSQRTPSRANSQHGATDSSKLRAQPLAGWPRCEDAAAEGDLLSGLVHHRCEEAVREDQEQGLRVDLSRHPVLGEEPFTEPTKLREHLLDAGVDGLEDVPVEKLRCMAAGHESL